MTSIKRSVITFIQAYNTLGDKVMEFFNHLKTYLQAWGHFSFEGAQKNTTSESLSQANRLDSPFKVQGDLQESIHGEKQYSSRCQRPI